MRGILGLALASAFTLTVACGEAGTDIGDCTPSECGASTPVPPLIRGLQPVENGVVLTVRLTEPAVAVRFYRKTEEGEWKFVGFVSTEQAECCTFTEKGLEPGKSYTYTATAIRPDGTETEIFGALRGRAGPLPTPPQGR